MQQHRSSPSSETFFALHTESDDIVLRIDFLIAGDVTHKGFRSHIKEKADELGLYGWVANTSTRKVMGHVEGNPDTVHLFKHWLKRHTPPGIHITKIEFSNETWAHNSESLPFFNVVYYY